MSSDQADLPVDYRELTEIPQDLQIANRIYEPILSIEREEVRNYASLEARTLSKGRVVDLAAPSIKHNWVMKGSRILPLPVDIPQVVHALLGGANPADLSLPEILRIQRESDDLLKVKTHESVFETANESAIAISGDIEVPGLHAELYPYQAEGVRWMAETLKRTGGLILADEMGLGKTMQILSLFLIDQPSNDSPALIVCPTTLIANWCREISRFAPSLTVLVHRGSDRTGVYTGLMRSQIVITTYDTLVNDITLLRSLKWSFLVCDEAQAIKNPSSRRRVAIGRIPRKNSIPVTGTPVENSLLDLWSLCDFAIPGLLGTKSEFELIYPDDEGGAKALAKATDPIVLKRRVSDVADDLPERIDIDLPLELDAFLSRKYEEVRKRTIEKYPTAGALVATGQLSLFCAHPFLYSNEVESDNWEDRVDIHEAEGFSIDTPKIERTIELLEEAFSVNRKVLIFANYNACGRLLRQAAAGLKPAFWASINGSTPQDERQGIVDEFSDYAGPGVLVLNPRAAGAGLNITAATIVIHFTQVWNPALEMQASARAHRRGQTEPVTIYRLYYENTVEQVMLDRSTWKRELADVSVPISSRDKTDLARALSLTPFIRQ